MNTTRKLSEQSVKEKTQNVAVSLVPVAISRSQSITPVQLRAARSLLDWSRSELANAAGLSPETIKNIEHGIYKQQDSTLQILFETLSMRGVYFLSVASINAVGVILALSEKQKSEEGNQPCP